MLNQELTCPSGKDAIGRLQRDRVLRTSASMHVLDEEMRSRLEYRTALRTTSDSHRSVLYVVLYVSDEDADLPHRGAA